MNAPPIAYAFSVILLIAAGLIVRASHDAVFGVVIAVILVLGAITIPSWLKMTDQWNRAIILRLGRFRGLGGPGLFTLIPFLESIAQIVDIRIRTTEIRAEEALTRDTVSIAMDAIVFWRVVDPQRAATEIEHYRLAVERVAQTSLRETIGSHDLTQLLSDRQTADEELRGTISRKDGDLGRRDHLGRDQGHRHPQLAAGRDEPPGAGRAGEAGAARRWPPPRSASRSRCARRRASMPRIRWRSSCGR